MQPVVSGKITLNLHRALRGLHASDESERDLRHLTVYLVALVATFLFAVTDLEWDKLQLTPFKGLDTCLDGCLDTFVQRVLLFIRVARL